MDKILNNNNKQVKWLLRESATQQYKLKSVNSMTLIQVNVSIGNSSDLNINNGSLLTLSFPLLHPFP